MPEVLKAVIRLHSRHEGEDVIQEMAAEVIAKAAALYVRYEEPEADLKGQVTRTTLKITADSLKMIRHGAVESEQTFQQGHRLPGFYRSPYASFNLSTHTRSLTMDMHGGFGQIQWDYDLYVYEELSGHFDISLHIQEANQS